MGKLFDLEKFGEQFSSLLANYAPMVVGAVLTLIIGFWIAGQIAGFIKKAMAKQEVDASVQSFVGSLVSVGLKIMVLLAAAGMFGVETTSFIAIFSALAFAIGLALQGNLAHMAAGILILIFKPYKVGDFIVTQGYSGTVKEIGLFNTVLTTLDNRIIIIPNGTVTGGPIENLTTNPVRKVPMTFGIGYKDDIDKARTIIQQVADSCPDIDHERPVDILVSELADSSVNFAVRPWCKTENYWGVHFYMTENIKKEFDKAGVGIPFPQMDVHVNQISAN